MRKVVKRVIITGVAVALILTGMYKHGEYLNNQEALQNSEVAQEEQLEQQENQISAGGNPVEWFDRIDRTGRKYLDDFYNVLVEASDGDGDADYLIDPTTAKRLDSDGNTYNFKRDGTTVKLKNVYCIDVNIGGDRVDTAVDYVFAVYYAFDYDHPEVFWLKSSTECIWKSGVGDTHIYFLLYAEYAEAVTIDGVNHAADSLYCDIREEHYQTPISITDDIKRRDAMVESIIASMPAKCNENWEKVVYFNDWLTHNNEYNTYIGDYDDSNDDQAPKAAWECISAFTSGNDNENGPVCEGYSRAFKVLCDEVGIPCVLVHGYRNATEEPDDAHMWNSVYIGDTIPTPMTGWYAVDVTGNDPSGEHSVPGTRDLLIGSNAIRAHYTLENSWENNIKLTDGPELMAGRYSTYYAISCRIIGGGGDSNFVCPPAAVEGATVDLIPLPGEEFTFESWDVYYETGEKWIQIDVTDNQFTMPNHPVTIKGKFVSIYAETYTYTTLGIIFALCLALFTILTMPVNYKEVVPCKYDDAYAFSEGLALVKMNGKYGYIDKTGNEIVSTKHDFEDDFSEELARVGLDGKDGHIEETDNEIVPCEYDAPTEFSEGLAVVEKNGKYGYIDKAGKEVVPCKYDAAAKFSEGLAAVKLNGKWGYISITDRAKRAIAIAESDEQQISRI